MSAQTRDRLTKSELQISHILGFIKNPNVGQVTVSFFFVGWFWDF